jgi:alpha/beta hydrolase family protein
MAACRLGPRTQRLIFGEPPSIDGQRLGRDAHALIKLARIAGDTTLAAGMTVEEARAATRRRTAAAAARSPIRMARVEEVEVAGGASPLPARHYVPAGLGDAAPLLVFLHGGGWVLGDLDTHDGLCRLLASKAGVAVLSSPTGWRRRLRSRRRSRTPSPRSAGPPRTLPPSVPTRTGSRSAATAPVATWRPRCASSPATRARRCRRCSSCSTRPPTRWAASAHASFSPKGSC